MKRILAIIVLLAVSVLLADAALAADLPSHEAPFGLRFGMKASEIALPLSPPPTPPKQRVPQPSLLKYGIYPSLFPSEEERREQREYEVRREARDALAKGCSQTFDTPFRANYQDGGWLEWTAVWDKDGELSDIDPFEILDRAKSASYRRFHEQVEGRNFPKPSDFRSLSFHIVSAAGVDRAICLVFTADGLSHIYAPRSALKDVIEDIYHRLNANPDYLRYTSSRYLEKGSSTMGLSLSLVTLRNSWFDAGRRILVAAKEFEYVEKGFMGRVKKLFMKYDFYDDLDPYIAYTDLSRRAEAFRRYREGTLPVLSAAISDAAEADATLRKRKEDIERAKREREGVDRKGLVESFR
jgi:hypothetical protein